MTQAPFGGTGLDRKNVKQLKKLIKRTGAKIILISDWRFNSPFWRNQFPEWKTAEDDWNYLITYLKKYKIEIFDVVKFNYKNNRTQEVLETLNQIKPCRYVILDDLSYTDARLISHLVSTNPDEGLTKYKIIHAEHILNTIWE